MRLLGVAAVVGRKVDHDLLARLSDLSERELYEALEEAVAGQLLVVDESAVMERYEFRHALIAEAAAESILPSQRRRLHVTIAEALEKMPARRGAEEAGHLAEIAHHWFEARELPRALVASINAAESAASASAFVEAFRQDERALELWDVVQDPETVSGLDRVELLRRAAQAGQLSGEFMAAAGLLRDGIAILETSGDSIRAGLLYERLGRALWTSGKLDESLEAYRTAVERVPDAPTADRARVLSGYAQMLMLGGRYRESVPIAEEANAIARAAGQRQLEGHSAATLGTDLVYASPTGDEDGIRLINEAILIAEEVHDIDDIGRGYACLSSASTSPIASRKSVVAASKGAERMRELGLSATYGSFIQMNVVDGLISLGRWDEALRMTEAAEPVSPRERPDLREPPAGQAVHDARVVRRRRTGHRPRGEQSLQAPQRRSSRDRWRSTRMDLALWLRDIDGCAGRCRRVHPILEQTEDGSRWRGSTRGRCASRRKAPSVPARRETHRRRRRASRRAERCLTSAWTRSMMDARAGATRTNISIGILIGEGRGDTDRGRADPAAWAAAVAAADARPVVAEAAYARYRLAEAILAERGSREEAATQLAQLARWCRRSGPHRCCVAIDGLAARARLPLGDGPSRVGERSGRAAGDRRVRPHAPRGGGAPPRRGRANEPPDRRGALHQREHGRRPRLAHPRQARGHGTGRGGHDRGSARPRGPGRQERTSPRTVSPSP